MKKFKLVLRKREQGEEGEKRRSTGRQIHTEKQTDRRSIPDMSSRKTRE